MFSFVSIFLHYSYTEAYFRYSVFLGCSYLFEMENEVHNNSSVEIYYQVSEKDQLLVCLTSFKNVMKWMIIDSFSFLSVIYKPLRVTFS